VIKVDHLSKQYRLGMIGTGSLAHDMTRAWYRFRGREDPYLKIGEENDRTSRGTSDYVWALRDINFEVQHGEVLGIIGRNGAGKSTLLKILSRTTSPTSGSVKVKGRIASLLEVGTGFHPELSGRENIFLNGAILGMTRKEIKSKFDEIVEFAGVERYIDTPVKRYSSGMYVRLAFAVAAHLEPEILVVDEVLAVGDAEFQRKALGKMKDVSGKDGRTVLFVSHNMGAIRQLCNATIILKNGATAFMGGVEEGITTYLEQDRNDNNSSLAQRTDREGTGLFRFENIHLQSDRNGETESVFCNDALTINLHFSYKEIDISQMVISVGFKDQFNELIAFFSSDEMGFKLTPGINEFNLHIPKVGLRPGTYTIWLFAAYKLATPENYCDIVDGAATITVLASDYWHSGKMLRSRNAAFFDGVYLQDRPAVSE
ncbi:MAG TPA: ABC transporter ATP-binding protein, partial [Chitinophagaceae bacterium]|nr:ABC transporter ATP-binding protein [Chitinophagaceae bacterium]